MLGRLLPEYAAYTCRIDRTRYGPLPCRRMVPPDQECLSLWIFSGMLRSGQPDVLFVLMVYAVSRISVGNAFIACMLTLVGYSINATIVVFDRIRENMKEKLKKDSVEDVVNSSISQTISRSINTSLTTFVMVLALSVFGVSSIREFSVPLMAGIVCGAYSSVFLAGTLWYHINKLRAGKEQE